MLVTTIKFNSNFRETFNKAINAAGYIALYVVLSHSVTRYTTAVYIATLPPSAAIAIEVCSSWDGHKSGSYKFILKNKKIIILKRL